jgi:hypothetical protein
MTVGRRLSTRRTAPDSKQGGPFVDFLPSTSISSLKPASGMPHEITSSREHSLQDASKSAMGLQTVVAGGVESGVRLSAPGYMHRKKIREAADANCTCSRKLQSGQKTEESRVAHTACFATAVRGNQPVRVRAESPSERRNRQPVKRGRFLSARRCWAPGNH